ncbi:DUF4350 domain-containing protein [uncultured Brevibacterium sp.]|uniref:DUF4350 domain-containing protein n=1 Tax=uncultured Brevibacterium sp. TaxID=189678 RepID=UPI0025F5B30E|nr:DUF4350 domain-containing protein [uncultured Brevibacterium sp.]
MSAHLDVAVRGTVGDTSASAGQRIVAFGKSAVVWIVVVAIVLIAAIIGFLTSTDPGEYRDLHYDNTGEEGTAALAGVLRSHGVKVSTTEDYDTALAAAQDADTTLFVLNPHVADQAQRNKIRDAVQTHGSHVALVNPGFAVAGYTSHVSFETGSMYSNTHPEPSCDFGPASRAGKVERSGAGYRVLSDKDYEGCYPMDGDAYSLIHTPEGKGSVTVLSESSWVTNTNLREDGNAALSTGVAGLKPKVVFYYAMSDSDEPDPLSTVPGWFYMTLLWLLPISLVAVVWAGRRFGPLAVETLPVTVPPIETVTGLAGLMHRTGNRAEALRILRASALVKMGRTLAVPAHADAAEVCQAVAARTGVSYAELEYLFITAAPTNDAQLSELATRIADIEREVRAL